MFFMMAEAVKVKDAKSDTTLFSQLRLVEATVKDCEASSLERNQQA